MGTQCSAVGESLHSRSKFYRGIGFELSAACGWNAVGHASHSRLERIADYCMIQDSWSPIYPIPTYPGLYGCYRHKEYARQ